MTLTFEKSPQYFQWIALESGQSLDEVKNIPVATLMELYPETHKYGPYSEPILNFVEMVGKNSPIEINSWNLMGKMLEFTSQQPDQVAQLATDDPLRYVAANIVLAGLNVSYSDRNINHLLPYVPGEENSSEERAKFQSLLVNTYFNLTAADIVPEDVRKQTRKYLDRIREAQKGAV